MRGFYHWLKEVRRTSEGAGIVGGKRSSRCYSRFKFGDGGKGLVGLAILVPGELVEVDERVLALVKGECVEVYYECMEPIKFLTCLWVRSRSIAAIWLEKVVTPLIEPAIKVEFQRILLTGFCSCTIRSQTGASQSRQSTSTCSKTLLSTSKGFLKAFVNSLAGTGLLISDLLFTMCEEASKVESCPSEIILDDLLALDSIVRFDLGDRRLEQTATFSISTNSE
nr:hypothetical protein [Tanacetum cinerariifolium]